MNRDEFLNLERRLIEMGLDADLDSFAAIKEKLQNKKPAGADEFARQAVYVVLAGGFSQKTAKKIHNEVMNFLRDEGEGLRDEVLFDSLIKIFNNKNKINAIVKLWKNRAAYCGAYYGLSDLESKLAFLAGLPHIGKITANHLARNLGENVFKRDVWIERLLARYGEDLFDRLEAETGLPRGYIDVVLWKACQNGLVEL